MIAIQTLAATPLQPSRTSVRDAAPRPLRDEKSGQPLPLLPLPSLAQTQDARKAQAKDMAAKKVQAVRERMNALKLMVKIDPRAALKMTAQFAKELRAAVKEFVDAGGRNPTNGEMKMAMRDAEQARDAADFAAQGVPADPGVTPTDETPAPIDAEARRAQATYAAAAGMAQDADGAADRLEAVVGAAFADMGFFEQVKLALGDIKSARDKIRADWAHPKAPSKDDWKAADRELAELERAIDLAPTGMPEPPQTTPATVTI